MNGCVTGTRTFADVAEADNRACGGYEIARHQVCSLRQRFAVGEVVAAFLKRPESVRHPVTNHRLPRSRWAVLAGSDEASRPEIGLQSLNYWSF